MKTLVFVPTRDEEAVRDVFCRAKQSLSEADARQICRTAPAIIAGSRQGGVWELSWLWHIGQKLFGLLLCWSARANTASGMRALGPRALDLFARYYSYELLVCHNQKTFVEK